MTEVVDEQRNEEAVTTFSSYLRQSRPLEKAVIKQSELQSRSEMLEAEAESKADHRAAPLPVSALAAPAAAAGEGSGGIASFFSHFFGSASSFSSSASAVSPPSASVSSGGKSKKMVARSDAVANTFHAYSKGGSSRSFDGDNEDDE